MKHLFSILTPILILAACLFQPGLVIAQNATSTGTPASPPSSLPTSIPQDEKNARQARDLIQQAIEALGGPAYLNLRDMEEHGRVYSFYHGHPTSNGIFFWRFQQFADQPSSEKESSEKGSADKERMELTPQRDIAYVYTGDKGYEITYKGSKAVEKKDLDDHIRRHRLSLEVILRTWISDPTVALFFDGAALAGSLAAQKVTLIDSKDESVEIYFDIDSHLPIKKTYSWRDPIDKQKNTEEESFDGYRLVGGVMTCFNFTRYFNGDMQTERFLNTVTYNQGLNQAMFDPNSGYNPIKAEKKH